MTRCLILSDDLIDASRVIGHGRDAGAEVVMQRTPAGLLQAAAAIPPACVFLDLQVAGSEIDTLVSTLKAGGPVRVVGYGSHVDVPRLKAARAAGCDEVLHRSAFFKGLTDRFPEWLKNLTPPAPLP